MSDDKRRMRKLLRPGDPAPWFRARASNNPGFNFNAVGGRYLVLACLGSLRVAATAAMLQELLALRPRYDDANVSFFGVTADPTDGPSGRAVQLVPGVRWFFDDDLNVSRLYGAAPLGGDPAEALVSLPYFPMLYLIDPGMRVLACWDLGGDPRAALAAYAATLAALPPPHDHAGIELAAPVLVLPRIFEPEFCRMLVGLYEANGGEESGFMQEENGVTVGKVDYGHKRRADYSIADPAVRNEAAAKIVRRLNPEIRKYFNFEVTRMERYIVACYDGEIGGYFRPHRDNTTKGTAHRRFAVTINLNADDYDGGDLRFPEFGRRTYRAPTGGCVVFSCSMLHEATPVTRGRRYAFLPFLYDEAGARVREENNRFLAPDIGFYKADVAPGTIGAAGTGTVSGGAAISGADRAQASSASESGALPSPAAAAR